MAEVQNIDPKRKLFDALSKEKYYTKSYDDFNKQFSTPESVGKLYSALNKEGYYTKTKKDFEGTFFPKSNEVSTQGSKNTSQIFTEPSVISQSNPFGKVPTAKTIDVVTGKVGKEKINVGTSKPKNSFIQDLGNSVVAGVGQLGSIATSIPSGLIDTYGKMNPTNQGLVGGLGILGDWIKDIKTTDNDNLAIQYLGRMVNGTKELKKSTPNALDAEQFGKISEKYIGIPEEFNPLSPNNVATKYFTEVQKSNHDKANANYKGGIWEAIKNGEYSTAGKLATLGAVESLPLVLGMVASRGAGLSGNQLLTALGVGTTEVEYQQLKEQNPNIDKNILLVNAQLTGLGEAGSELVGTNLLYDQAKTLFKKGAKDEAEKLLKTGVKSFLDNMFKKSFVGASALSDSSGEMVNQVWKNAIDKWSGVDPERDYTDGVIDAGIISLVSSGGLAVGAKIASKIINPTIKQEVKEQATQISDLSKDVDNASLPEQTRGELLKQTVKTTEKLNNKIDKQLELFNQLTEVDQKKVESINDKIDVIDDALSAENITPTTKTTLEEQKVKLEEQLSEIKPLEPVKAESEVIIPVEEVKVTEGVKTTPVEGVSDGTTEGATEGVTPTLTPTQETVQVKPKFTIKGEQVTPKIEQVVPNAVQEQEAVPQSEQEQKNTQQKVSEEFKNKIDANIESEEVVKTLSNISEESLLKLDEAESNLNRIHLEDALAHGEGIVESSKKEFGDKYVDGLINYLENTKVKPYIESLAVISLENDLNRRILAEPENNLTLRKQLKRVQNISVNIQRDKARAVAFGILRRIGRVGYDVDRVTNEVFSNRQLIEKSEIENAIQATPNQINEVALEQETLDVNNDITPEVQKIIDDSIEAEVNKIYKALPTKRRQTADRAIKKLESFQKKLRGRAYDATIGIPIQIIDSGITTIKYAIKAGVSIADAVELGIKKIKEKYGKEWKNESRFRNDMLEEFKEITTPTDKSKSIKIIVKNALIEAGYGREVTVNTKNGKEKRNILDWKKLAGEEGSVDNIREAVDKSLKNEGYTQEEITSMQDNLIEEYNNLRASIIEKGLNEIARRNKVRPLTDPKSSAKRLAELYNYGLFEQDPTEYNNLISSAVGLSLTEQKMLAEAQEIAKTLADIYSYKNPKTGKPYTDLALSSQIASVNLKIEKLLSRVVRHKGSLAFKVTGFINAWMGGALRAKLLSVRNAVENIQSGVTERLIDKVSNIFKETSKSNKLLNRAQRIQALNLFLDSTFNVGTEYGGIGSPFVSKNEIEDFINKGSKNQIYHAIISTVMGKTYLEGTDSFNKVILTEKQFNRNLLKILTSPTNPKRMTIDEGVAYITEATTGLSLREAYINAKDLVETINKKAGKEMIPNNTQSLNRLASGMVKDALVNGQAFTKEQVRAAFEAAYTTAGHGLGHEANNPISRALKDVNGRMELALKRAVKEENWAEATVWQTGLIINKNILSPFVGGGTNWVNLALQKMGMPIAPLLQPEFFAKNKGIDVTTVEGIRNLKNSLELDGTRKKAFARTFIGAMTSLTIYALARASGEDDDIYEFMKKNPYLKKFFDKIAPPVLVAMMYAKDDKLGDFWEKILNQRSETITDSYKLSKAIGKTISGVSKDNEKDKIDGIGEIGAVIGDKFTTPFAPIGIYTDMMTIFDGINGIEPKKVDKKARGFWNGWFKTGIAKEFDLRPNPTTTRQLVYDKPYEIEIGAEGNKKIIKLDEKQVERRINYANDYINKYGKLRAEFLIKKYTKNNKENLGLIEIHEKVDRALEREAMSHSRIKIISDINSGKIKVDKNTISDK